MSGAHILLVEDDAVLRTLLRRNLEARQHQVSSAQDAQEALALLQRAAFDLIILDINLPDQTGWELLRLARQQGCLRESGASDEQAKLPVVIVSAVRVSLERLKEFEPLAYLPKPFPIEALLRLAEDSARRGRKDARSA